jgi:hypothetical protein
MRSPHPVPQNPGLQDWEVEGDRFLHDRYDSIRIKSLSRLFSLPTARVCLYTEHKISHLRSEPCPLMKKY